MIATPPVWPGHHAPLGATVDDEATNFAVWSPDASGVDVCLFDDNGLETSLALTERSTGVWHGRIPGVGAGQEYGFRAHGCWDPDRGVRFNPAKLLLDPYAKAVCGEYDTAEMDSHDQDSAPFVPRSVVVADDYDWGDDDAPCVPWAETVIYELHVKGFTQQHPGVPERLRGTYAGLGHPAVVGYLRELGITAVELLPVHQHITEPELSAAGLTNYWGYNSIGFFAPHHGYSATGERGEQVREFKEMVRALHRAGIEVILDVVYNHTAEGDADGPTLAFRGYGDLAYYRHTADGAYVDLTGCRNTLDTRQQQVLGLVLDSLRYWVTEMRVDGFRLDLAPALARNGRAVDLQGPFLSAVCQDPVLRQAKLIAEPWDATPDAHSVGSFPAPWCEWNDRFRDTVRDFWRGESRSLRDLGNRLSGSSDLYSGDGRPPHSSVNFVTAHDGFTLRDLVSYNHKHNQANGQGNRDGSDGDRSWNCGVEGETDDEGVHWLRQRQAANLMSTLLLSTGVPMLVAGDERGRTQRGNNNAFCQDNEISWVDWSDAADNGDWSKLTTLTRHLLDLRRRHPVLRQRHFFAGRPLVEGGRNDLTWVNPAGHEMSDADWHDHDLRTLGLFLAGDAIRSRGVRGEAITDRSFLIWLHAGADDRAVSLPDLSPAYDEVVRTDRLDRVGDPVSAGHRPGQELQLGARSLVVLRAR